MSEVLEAFCGTPEQNEKNEILIFFFFPVQIVCILSLHQLETLKKLNSKIPNSAGKFLVKKYIFINFLLVFSVIFSVKTMFSQIQGS